MDWSIIFKYKSSVNWGLNCGLATERGIKNPITFAFYLRKFKFVKGLRKKMVVTLIRCFLLVFIGPIWLICLVETNVFCL